MRSVCLCPSSILLIFFLQTDFSHSTSPGHFLLYPQWIDRQNTHFCRSSKLEAVHSPVLFSSARSVVLLLRTLKTSSDWTSIYFCFLWSYLPGDPSSSPSVSFDCIQHKAAFSPNSHSCICPKTFDLVSGQWACLSSPKSASLSALGLTAQWKLSANEPLRKSDRLQPPLSCCSKDPETWTLLNCWRSSHAALKCKL